MTELGARALRSAEVMLYCARLQMAEVRTSWIVIGVTIFQPVVFLLVALLPASDRSAEVGTRVAIGVALSVSWSATAWGAASVLRRERAMGTLARALAGLVDARLIVLGKGLGAALLSNIWALSTLAVTLVALRQPVSFAHPGWLIVGFVVLLASGSAIGLLIGSVFVLTRYGAQVSAFLTFPVILLGGMLIPPDVLPTPLTWVSAGISLRWLQEFLVTSSAGAPNLTALGYAVLLTVGYALGGIRLFGRIVDRGRREGPLASPERAAERRWRAGRIIRFGFVQYRADNPPRIVLLAIWPRLVFQTVFWVLLGFVAAGDEGARFAYVGAVATVLTLGGLAGMSDVPVDDKFAGTYSRLLGGLTPSTLVFFGRGVAQLAMSVVEMLVALIAAGLLTGLWRTMLALVPLLPIYLVIALTMAAMGLATASFCVGKRAEVAIYNAAMYLVILCSGALIPRGTLPALDVIGAVLPATHGLLAVRGALADEPWLTELLWEAAVGVGWLVLAYTLFNYQAVRSRRTGSDHFS